MRPIKVATRVRAWSVGLVLASATLQVLPSVAMAAEHAYTGPKCLGRFCLDAVRILRVDLIKAYGPSRHFKGYLCYQDPATGVFVQFGFSGGVDPRAAATMFVSTARNCARSSKALQSFGGLKTPEGIGIEDAYAQVIRVYGAPTTVEAGTGLEMVGIDYKKKMATAPFGDKVLNYLNADERDPLTAAIYLSHGKVSAISISNAE